MRWIIALVLFPSLVSASEECVAQLQGRCRPACAPDEKSEQGAFTDCRAGERCCVPRPVKESGTAAAPVVVIAQMAFSPATLRVRAGTEVVWRNDDASIHTVTAGDGSFGSSPLDKGAVFKKVFPKPGTYSYSCEMHPFMSATIVVE